jgi:hypothetical protein
VTVDLDVLDLALSFLVVGAGVTAIVVAAFVLVRHRRGRRIRVLGRVVDSPRLWAATLFFAGAAGLLFVAREEVMPSSWQRPSLYLWAALQLAFIILSLAHGVVDQRAKRASNGNPEASR